MAKRDTDRAAVVEALQRVGVDAHPGRWGVVVAGQPELTLAQAAHLVSARRLFIGVYPTGLSYADRLREKGGDYARVAFLDYRTLSLDVEADCPRELVAQVEASAHAMRARCGQEFDVSTSGQTVLLGSALGGLPPTRG